MKELLYPIEPYRTYLVYFRFKGEKYRVNLLEYEDRATADAECQRRLDEGQEAVVRVRTVTID